MRIGSLVIVYWYDSNMTHGWRVNESVLEDKLALCRHVGILKRETETELVLAFGDSELGSVSEAITIAKTSIKSIRELRVK